MCVFKLLIDNWQFFNTICLFRKYSLSGRNGDSLWTLLTFSVKMNFHFLGVFQKNGLLSRFLDSKALKVQTEVYSEYVTQNIWCVAHNIMS
nr:MAG TPA: hypothetical protein [Caudoviricetes sp.]